MRGAAASTRCWPPTGSARGWPGAASQAGDRRAGRPRRHLPLGRGDLRLHRRALGRVGRGLRAGAAAAAGERQRLRRRLARCGSSQNPTRTRSSPRPRPLVAAARDRGGAGVAGRRISTGSLPTRCRSSGSEGGGLAVVAEPGAPVGEARARRRGVTGSARTDRRTVRGAASVAGTAPPTGSEPAGRRPRRARAGRRDVCGHVAYGDEGTRARRARPGRGWSHSAPRRRHPGGGCAKRCAPGSDHQGELGRVAAVLNVHPQTVRYRSVACASCSGRRSTTGSAVRARARPARGRAPAERTSSERSRDERCSDL